MTWPFRLEWKVAEEEDMDAIATGTLDEFGRGSSDYHVRIGRSVLPRSEGRVTCYIIRGAPPWQQRIQSSWRSSREIRRLHLGEQEIRERDYKEVFGYNLSSISPNDRRGQVRCICAIHT